MSHKETNAPQDWQRRTIALVDVAPDRFYCLDLYRISGGAEQWWCFHAQKGEFATQGLDLAKLEGTLAGPDVPYGDADWLKSHGCSYGTYGWSGRWPSPGKIVAVDRTTEAITVAPPPPDVAALVGAEILISNPDRRIAYRVLEAQTVADGAHLRLNYDSRIGTGRCSGAADFRVLTTTPMPLHRFRYYHGARLTNAGRSAEYRITDVRSESAVFIDAKAHADATAAKLASQFPIDSWFDVYDYGIGDEVIWPYTVSVTLASPGQYQVTAPVPVKVSLPEGAKIVGGAAAK